MPEDNNFDPAGYSLEDMTEEEKNRLLVRLANEYNGQLNLNAEQHNAMIVMADRLLFNNKFGKRRKLVLAIAESLQMVAAITRMRMGVDLVQQQVDSTFEDIVAGLDMSDGEGER